MNFSFQTYLFSYISQKFFAGLGGLMISLFVFVHMVANLSILLGAQSYNLVSYALVSNPLFELFELGLAGAFILHIVFAISVNIRNRSAKGQDYAVRAKGGRGTSFVQRTLVFQGVVLLIFLVLHLIQFKWGEHYMVSYDGLEMRDFFTLVASSFESFPFFLFYVVSIFILGLHLRSGICATFQSLGLVDVDCRGIQVFGQIYAIVVTVGFWLPAFYLYFGS